MRLRLLFAFIFCLFATAAAADSIDLGFNDESFQIGYERPLASDNYGTSVGNARLLYNDDEETLLGSLGFDFIGEPGNVPGLDVGVGAKLYGGTADDGNDTDFLNLAVGVRAAYAPPPLWGLGADARFYYAPKIFSFIDSERLMESDLRLTYAVVPKVKVYLGYHNVRLKDEDSGHTHTIDDGIRLGFIGYF